MVWLRSRYWWWVISGLLLGVGFVVPFLWPAGLAGVVYFLYLLQQDVPLKEKLLGAWLSWTIMAGFSVGWIWSTYPVDWLPAEMGSIQLVLIFTSWFMTGVSLGFGAVAMVLIAVFIKQQLNLPAWSLYFLLYPILWLFAEIVGSLAFSIFFYGTGGVVNTAFSFGYAGYLLAEHEVFLQLARAAGVYGLSFIFVLMAGGILFFRAELLRRWPLVLVCSICVFAVGFVPLFQTSNLKVVDGHDILMVDTQFSSRLGSSELGQKQMRAKLEEAVAFALTQESGYIVLPEDSRYFDQSRPPSSVKAVFKIKYNEPEVVIIDSGRATVGSQTVLQSFVYNGLDDSVDRFHKRLLVPQGEYVSAVYEKILRWAGRGNFLDFYAQGLSYEVGPWTSQSSGSAQTPGILFCFESFDPQGVRTLTKERPNMPFVAHIASHAWFHEPKTLWSQTETMLRVQALWNQQYIVSVGNMMPGMAYSPSGALINPEVIESGDGWEVKRFVVPK
jgi:apolipoprotein N-acyltransferase